MPAAFGLVIGILSTILSAVWISKALGLSDTIQATSAVKAVTTQVAIAAVVLIGGDPALAAAFVISSGIFGAVFGPALLSFMKINDPFSRGLGIGTVSHGIGTSQAVVEGRLQVPFQALRWGLRPLLPLSYFLGFIRLYNYKEAQSFEWACVFFGREHFNYVFVFEKAISLIICA
jgi:putative effector of murein hydrolase